MYYLFHTKKFYIGILLLLIFITIIYGLYNKLSLSAYTYTNSKIPKSFNDFRIVLVSDLHCKSFGQNQKQLIHMIQSCKPDIVVLAGDMIDKNRDDITPVEDLLSGLTDYPIYAISGNHEYDNSALFASLLHCYERYHVKFLDNDSVSLTYQNQSIGLYGKKYQYYYGSYTLYQPTSEGTEFNILLIHNAAAFDQTCLWGYDLVLGGHTHGGIIRLPFIGGLINNEGHLFSSYDNGIYKEGDSTLVSSRGLGDSVIPRFNNRPEVVCVTLKSDN